MQPIDPRKVYRNRIDILKRLGKKEDPRATNDIPEGYHNEGLGVNVRNEPKKPGRYAVRKQTKRYRKFMAAQKASA